MKKAWRLLLALLLLAISSQAGGAARARPQPPPPAVSDPLRQWLALAPAQRPAWGQRMGLGDSADHVRLIIEHDGSLQIPATVRVERQRPGLLQVFVTPGQAQQLPDLPGVQRIRPALPHRPAVISSEGLYPAGLFPWHAAGWTGTGVDIAVIDAGFAGYQDMVTAGELPAVDARSFRADGRLDDGEHGTAVAEIVHDSAPAAALHLYAFNTDVELAAAVDAAIAAGVQVIVHAISWFNTGPGDGTGPLADITRQATQAGVLWVNSAGNQAQSHYRAMFNGGDNDFHDFTASDETEDISLAAGAWLCAFLSWDAWPAANDDYDLYLYHGQSRVAQSENRQTGSQPPTETLCYQAPEDGVYELAVRQIHGQPRLFDLFTDGAPLQYATPAWSLAQPADVADVLAVGAVFWRAEAGYQAEVFSSRGPTSDGRIKPDLVAYDGVSTATWGMSNNRPYTAGGTGFFGTSAAAPHVAGAAAVLWQRYPTWTRTEVQDYLRNTAVLDLGVAGPDNTYGGGRLHLPAATSTTTPTASPTPISTSTPSRTPTPTSTPTPTHTPSPTPTSAPTRTPTPSPTPTATPTGAWLAVEPSSLWLDTLQTRSLRVSWGNQNVPDLLQLSLSPAASFADGSQARGIAFVDPAGSWQGRVRPAVPLQAGTPFTFHVQTSLSQLDVRGQVAWFTFWPLELKP